MKLQLTDIELSILADLVYAGNYVINSLRQPDEVIYPYQEMSERISLLQRDSVSGKRSMEIKDFDDIQYMRVADCIEAFSEQKTLDFFARLMADREVGKNGKDWSDVYEKNLERLKEEGLSRVLGLIDVEK